VASDQNVLETLLAIRLQKEATEATKAGLREMRAGFVDLAATAEKGSNAASTLTKKLGEINRGSQIEKLGKDFGVMAGKIGDADKAAALLAGRLANIGASSGEIEKAGQAFASAQAASSGSGAGLRLAGSQLRQLPSMQIPGLGIGTDAIANIIRMAGALEGVAKTIPGVTTAASLLTPALGATAAGFVAMLLPIAAIGVALAPLIITLKVLSDELGRNEKAYQDNLDALKAETEQKNANIELARTRSAEQNRQEANDAQQRFENQQDLLAKLQAQRAEIDKEYANLGANLDPFKRKELADNAAATDKAIEEATKTLGEYGQEVENTVRVLGPEIDAREKEEAAIKAETDALKAKEQAIADAGKVELEARQLAKTATEEQVKTLLDQIATQRAVLAEQAKEQEKLGVSSKVYTDQIVMLDARTRALTETTLKAARANDEAKDKAKSLEVAGKAAAKYYDDVKTANDKFAENQAEIAQKLIDKQADIQAQAVEAAEQLLQGLQQKQADLQKNLGREFADQDTKRQNDNIQRQIDFARKDATAEKKAQDDILAIKRKAKEDEFELALDRDFAGLAKARRGTLSQVSNVSKQAQDDRQERVKAFQEQSEDQNRAFINERQQKIVQYQRSLADAQEAYKRDQTQLTVNRNRALAAAQLANQKELQVLNDKHTKELAAKYAAAKAEIDLAQRSSAVRNQILTAEYQHALAVFQGVSRLGGGGGRATATRAGGGSLGAFQLSTVNEPYSSGNETFSSGGQSAAFPSNTAGYFLPFKSGQVNANNGGGGSNVAVSNTFNISGGNPKDIAKAVDDRLEQSIRRIFKVKASA